LEIEHGVIHVCHVYGRNSKVDMIHEEGDLECDMSEDREARVAAAVLGCDVCKFN